MFYEFFPDSLVFAVEGRGLEAVAEALFALDGVAGQCKEVVEYCSPCCCSRAVDENLVGKLAFVDSSAELLSPILVQSKINQNHFQSSKIKFQALKLTLFTISGMTFVISFDNSFSASFIIVESADFGFIP